MEASMIEVRGTVKLAEVPAIQNPFSSCKLNINVLFQFMAAAVCMCAFPPDIQNGMTCRVLSPIKEVQHLLLHH